MPEPALPVTPTKVCRCPGQRAGTLGRRSRQTAAAHPLYRERYQHTKRQLGRQRGAKVAQIDLARKLTEAIWYMLTRNQPFAPTGSQMRTD